MSKINSAVREINLLEEQANQNNWLNQIHPLAKMILTIQYIALVVSFDKYNTTGLLGMVLYPLVLFLVCELPFGQCLKRIWVIMPFLLLVGVSNPFFDREIIAVIGGVAVSGGCISMFNLLVKGILTILAGYFLVVTTSMEQICAAMRMLHLPQILVTVVLLIYRYISVLLKEADRMTQAYALRAPGQKGIHFKAWGTLIGQLLLRSIDRAEDIYDSMCMRGFESAYHKNAFHYALPEVFGRIDFIWLVAWSIGFICLRFIPLFEMVGTFIVS